MNPTNVTDLAEGAIQLLEFDRSSRRVSNSELLSRLFKIEPSSSRLGRNLGRQLHPFDFGEVTDFKFKDVHHSACIEAKVNSTIGLGWETPSEKRIREQKSMPPPMPAPAAPGAPAPAPMPMMEEPDPSERSAVEEAMDPLCEDSFLSLMTDVVEDFWQTGNGYIEVVRESPGGPVAALYHVPSRHVYKFLDNEKGDYHFEVVGIENQYPGTEHFARFGDVEGLLERSAAGELEARGATGVGLLTPDQVSEIIHFRRPTALSRWYGFPDWLAAVATIELVEASVQHQFDFFYNRGVPEFMLFFLGQKLSKEDWKKVESAIRANIGSGNSHKSIALNIQDPEMRVELHRLAVEHKVDSLYAEIADVNAARIVSAHGVPPLLAGIQIPRKLGATNELPNALQAFQILKIGPAQRLIETMLVNSLGNQELSGITGLQPSDWTFKKITDAILDGAQGGNQMDTISRMRQTLPEAISEGRDLSDGLKD